MKIPYDPRNPDFEAVRQIFFAWLRADPRASQLPIGGEGLQEFVDWVGPKDPQILAFHAVEVFWRLLVEGIVAPGMDSSNMNLPWFHLTAYGRKVIAAEPGHPHDLEGYLARIRKGSAAPDGTVLAYITESLTTFRQGSVVAAAVMLGIAAERVFLLVCDALCQSLADPNEKLRLEGILERFPMKPKLDWVHSKLLGVQARRVAGFPESAVLMVTAIYDLLRAQRNDLGHPREIPPQLDREEVFASLQVFPRFYQTSDELVRFLQSNRV